MNHNKQKKSALALQCLPPTLDVTDIVEKVSGIEMVLVYQEKKNNVEIPKKIGEMRVERNWKRGWPGKKKRAEVIVEDM